MDMEQRQQWTAGLGFESLESIKLKAQNEDDLLHKQYIDAFGFDQALKMYNNSALPQMHAEYTNYWISAGVLAVKNEGKNGKSVETVLENGPNFSLLNADGMVAFGKTIVQFCNERYKVIGDGDFSKVDFLKNTIESKVDEDIYVTNLTRENNTLKSDPEFPQCPGTPFYRKYITVATGSDTWDNGAGCDQRAITAKLQIVNYKWKSNNVTYYYEVFQIYFTTTRRYFLQMKHENRDVLFNSTFNWQDLDRTSPGSNWVGIYGGFANDSRVGGASFFNLDHDINYTFSDGTLRRKYEYKDIYIDINDNITGNDNGNCIPDNLIIFDVEGGYSNDF